MAGPEIVEGVQVQALKQGIAIPGDLAVVSYGEQSWHQVIPGGITAIRLPEAEMARTCFDLLTSPDVETEQRIRIAPQLVERESSPFLL